MLTYFMFALNQFIFDQPTAGSVLKCMSKKLREFFFFFGKVLEVQSLTFSAKGGMIYPGRTSPPRTCDLTQVFIKSE